jgi:ElaB/YqjD/DUF883 family membrane-anchored ribosome-binding protein
MENIMEGTGSNARSGLAGGVETLNRATAVAHEGVDRAAAAVRPAIERAADLGHGAVDKATKAAEWAAEQRENLKSAQSRMIDNTSQFVTEHPLKSVTIAVVAGVILGKLFLGSNGAAAGAQTRREA